ncbi:hypothetical protein ACJX0J_007849, partial [Zea mays]
YVWFSFFLQERGKKLDHHFPINKAWLDMNFLYWQGKLQQEGECLCFKILATLWLNAAVKSSLMIGHFVSWRHTIQPAGYIEVGYMQIAMDDWSLPNMENKKKVYAGRPMLMGADYFWSGQLTRSAAVPFVGHSMKHLATRKDESGKTALA